MLSLPYVILVGAGTAGGLKASYEEAAQSSWAPIACRPSSRSPCRSSRRPSWADSVPATLSFDNITATLFWKKPGIETVPAKDLRHAANLDQPEINALGAVMIVITIALPLLNGYMVRRLSRGR